MDKKREILQGAKIGILDMTPLGVDDGITIPKDITLGQNFPNPFNSSTGIKFSTEGGEINLAIYDISGSLVKTLTDGIFDAGSHSVIWDGKDNSGISVSSGIYFYRLSDSKGEIVRRMTLLK